MVCTFINAFTSVTDLKFHLNIIICIQAVRSQSQLLVTFFKVEQKHVLLRQPRLSRRYEIINQRLFPFITIILIRNQQFQTSLMTQTENVRWSEGRLCAGSQSDGLRPEAPAVSGGRALRERAPSLGRRGLAFPPEPQVFA